MGDFIPTLSSIKQISHQQSDPAETPTEPKDDAQELYEYCIPNSATE